MQALNIGRAAAASGVSAKMIRHYEEEGVIAKARRTMSGYRMYSADDIHTLRFIRQARDLGFSVRQIATLLDLWRDRRRTSERVKSLALEQLRELDRKVAELEAMKAALEHLVHHCRGDERPQCPILDKLSAPDERAPGDRAAARPARRNGELRRGARR